MLRVLFAGVVFLHGIIHLMGFMKAFRLADLSQLQQDISRPIGVMWLLTAVLFLMSSGAFMMKREWWWILAAPALVLSQILIVLSWGDAKFGTIANVIVLVPSVVGFGFWNFNRMVDRELASLLSVPPLEKKVLTSEMIGGVPPVIRKWLERSNVVGKEIAGTVRLRQTGQMRSEPDGKWMAVEADQWFITGKPGFLWKAEVAAAPGISMVGRDKYVDGRGYLLIKALGWFAVADAKGVDVDQGTMLRYLAEICWFPAAAVSDYIRWREIDSLSAEATMSYSGVTASGIFRFDSSGDFRGFEARRYYHRETGSTLEDWLVQTEPDGYGEFEGVRVPVRSAATWKLKDGDFTWYKLQITDIRYNRKEIIR
jgi:hypothetical protein